MNKEELPLTDAAMRCRLSWHAAYAAMLRGEFGTPRRVGRQWLVPTAGVEAYIERTPSAEAIHLAGSVGQQAGSGVTR